MRLIGFVCKCFNPIRVHSQLFKKLFFAASLMAMNGFNTVGPFRFKVTWTFSPSLMGIVRSPSRAIVDGDKETSFS